MKFFGEEDYILTNRKLLNCISGEDSSTLRLRPYLQIYITV